MTIRLVIREGEVVVCAKPNRGRLETGEEFAICSNLEGQFDEWQIVDLLKHLVGNRKHLRNKK